LRVFFSLIAALMEKITHHAKQRYRLPIGLFALLFQRLLLRV